MLAIERTPPLPSRSPSLPPPLNSLSAPPPAPLPLLAPPPPSAAPSPSTLPTLDRRRSAPLAPVSLAAEVAGLVIRCGLTFLRSPGGVVGLWQVNYGGQQVQGTKADGVETRARAKRAGCHQRAYRITALHKASRAPVFTSSQHALNPPARASVDMDRALVRRFG